MKINPYEIKENYKGQLEEDNHIGEQSIKELNENITQEYLNKYPCSPIMHDFVLEQETEYDKNPYPHYAFISDFYPVNNVDISRLLQYVRFAINNDYKDDSFVDIYKHWLNYLRVYECDYHLYDWRNFNDQGEFVSRQDKLFDDNILDVYIDSRTDNTIMYDEVAEKQAKADKLNEEVRKLLNSGEYQPNFVLQDD